MTQQSSLSKLLNLFKNYGFLQTLSILGRRYRPSGMAHVRKLRERQHTLTRLNLEAESDGSITRRIHGSLIRLDVRPSSNRILEHDLAADGTREASSTEFYKGVVEQLKRDWNTGAKILVLDVGANIGYFALLQARILGESAYVIAVEADADNASRLQYNADLNAYDNIKVLACAAGAAAGSGNLSKAGSANVYRMSEIASDSDDLQPVDIVTIDGLVAEHAESGNSPVIVRMDVEGYEGHVFQGMTELLASKRPCYVFMELHQQAKAYYVSIRASLENNGFKLERIDAEKGDGHKLSRATYETIPKLTTHAHIFCRR